MPEIWVEGNVIAEELSSKECSSSSNMMRFELKPKRTSESLNDASGDNIIDEPSAEFAISLNARS